VFALFIRRAVPAKEYCKK
jgi:hypothetical protein